MLKMKNEKEEEGEVIYIADFYKFKTEFKYEKSGRSKSICKTELAGVLKLKEEFTRDINHRRRNG